MSISAKPWDSAGGGASSDTLNDVTGRGATTGNSIQVGGLNIAGNYAMPSADGSVNQVLQTDGSGSLSFTNISVTGGLTYKGKYYLSSPADLSNAVQGDFYIIQGDGTLYGKAWITGDHLVVNDDMGGSVSNGKIDKIDNTDLVTSVNALTGPVVLNGTNVDGDYTPSNYSTNAGSDKIEKHLEGIDNKFGTLGTASTSASTDFQPIDAGLTSISGLTTAADKMIYTSGSDTYAVTDLTSAGRALLDDANASAQRTTLGLVIGTDVSAIASPAFTGSPTAPTQSAGDDSTKIATTAYVDAAVTASGGATDLNGLSDVTITSAASGNLLQHNGSGQFINVAKSTISVGTFNDDNTYQPKDAGLTSIAGLTTAADKMIYTSGSDTYAVTDLTSAGRALLDDANATAQRSTLGLGSAALSESTDFQPIDAGLTSISGLTTAADKMIYTSGSDTYAVTDLTSAGRALLDDANATAQRATLGLVIGTDVSAIASPSFTGSPTAPTQSAGDDSTKIATTAYVEAAVTAGGGLSSVSADTSPELGGDLDVSSYDIKTTSGNAKIGLEAHGTGFTELRGNTTGGNNPGAIRFNCEQNSHGVILKSPLHADYDAANDYTLTLPTGLPASDKVLQSTSAGVLSWVAQSATDTTKLAILNNLSDLDNAGTARTNLGLVIGTNVQAYDAGLTSIAGLTTAADKMIYTSGSDTYAVTDLTSAGRALLDDANATAQRSTLGLGSAALSESTDFQPIDAGLTSISGLTTAADKMIYTSGSDTYAVTDLTSAGRALLDDANATAQRATLGLVIGTDVSAIASPAFTGSPTAPTQSAGDDSTKIATTAYVEAAVVAGGGLSSVVQDTSPELGGNLDVLSRSIVSSSNRAITLTPDGSGLVTISGNATSGSGQIKLNCEQNSHGIKLKSPPHSANADYTLVFPDDLGTSGKVLTTNGGGGGGSTIGTLTWETVSTTDTTKLAILNNLSDLDNAGTARTNLGLVIGTNVQAYDLGLTSIASLTTAADKMLYTDGSDSYAVTGLTSAGRALLDDADASAQRTTLGLVIGTDVAPIAAPAFTGNATAVTQSQSDNSTKLATTAYVDTAVAGGGGSKPTITTLGSQGANYTITTSSGIEEVFLITPTSNIDIVLEAAATCGAGYKYQIKNLASSYSLTLKGPSSETIDGVLPATGISIDAQFEAVTVITDGSNWFII